jgi:hypothetical protein
MGLIAFTRVKGNDFKIRMFLPGHDGYRQKTKDNYGE